MKKYLALLSLMFILGAMLAARPMPQGTNVAGPPGTNVSGQGAGTWDGTTLSLPGNMNVTPITKQYQIGGFTAIQFAGGDRSNLALGDSSLASITSGQNNTAVGGGALALNTTGSSNTAIGVIALQDTTGDYNVAVGHLAASYVTTGYANVGVGYSTFLNLLTGHGNTALGDRSGRFITTGNFNIYIGTEFSGTGEITTGSSNIAIGNGLVGLTPATDYQLDIGDVILGTGLNVPASSALAVPGTWGIGGGTPLATSNQSGTGNICMTTNCVLVTPNLGTPSAINLANATNIPAANPRSLTNCSSSAAPAVCASAAAGSVVIAAGQTTVTVNTTAVTANSQILVFPDETLGTKLSVTCNSTLATAASGLAITARTAATSFQISTLATVAVNPVCLSYVIVN